MSLGTLETQDDWNEMLACCCQMPLCPIPVMVCESLFAHFESDGFINVADPTFFLHLKQGWTGAQNQTGTTLEVSGDPEIDGQISQERTTVLDTFFGQSFDVTYEYQVGFGTGCPDVLPVFSDECTATGTSSAKNYSVKTYGLSEEDVNYNHGLDFERSNALSDASGEETDEHIAWETEFADEIAAWDAAHPDGPTWQEANTTHASWQTASDEYTGWTGRRDAWVAEDPENRDPADYASETLDTEPPTPGDEPETTGIDDEPEEFYGECTFRITQTLTWYAHYWGFNSDGSPATPAVDEESFADWFALGDFDFPPCPGTGTLKSYHSWSAVPSAMNESNSGDSGTAYAETYGFPDPPEPIDYAAWLAAVQEVVTAQMVFPKAGCTGTECEASYSVTEAPPAAPPTLDDNDRLILDSQRFRARFVIPSTWLDQFAGLTTAFTGTYFKITFNIVEEPDGWNDTIDDPEVTPPDPLPDGWEHPQIPKPGRPDRSFIPWPDAAEGEDPNDWVKEWTGPGITETPTSWIVGYEETDQGWIDVPPPTVPGRRYIANIRFVCQPDSPWGTLPQVTGPAVDIPPPEEP